MKAAAAKAVARELQEYRDYDCKHKATDRSPERWIKQFAAGRCTEAEMRKAERVSIISNRQGYRIIWVPITAVVSPQRSLSLRRLVYQIERHPIKQRPVVIRVKGGKFLLWDGNHRFAAAVLRGASRVKCKEIFQK